MNAEDFLTRKNAESFLTGNDNNGNDMSLIDTITSPLRQIGAKASQGVGELLGLSPQEAQQTANKTFGISNNEPQFAKDLVKGATGTLNLIANTAARKSLEGKVPEKALNSVGGDAQGLIQNIQDTGISPTDVVSGLTDLAKNHPGELVGSLIDPANIVGVGVAEKTARLISTASKSATIAKHVASDAAVFGSLGAAEQTAQNFIDGKELDNGVATAGGKTALLVGGLSGATRVLGAAAKRVVSGKTGEPQPDTPPVTPHNGEYNSSDILASLDKAPEQAPSVKKLNETLDPVPEQLPAQNLDVPTFMREGKQIGVNDVPNFVKFETNAGTEFVVPEFIKKKVIEDTNAKLMSAQGFQDVQSNIASKNALPAEIPATAATADPLALPAPRMEVTPSGVVRPESMIIADERQAAIVGRSPIIMRAKGKDLGYVKNPEKAADLTTTESTPIVKEFVAKSGKPFKSERGAMLSAKRAGINAEIIKKGDGFAYRDLEAGFANQKLLGGITIAGLAGFYGFSNPDSLKTIANVGVIAAGILGAKKISKWGPRSTSVHKSARGIFNDLEGSLAIRENDISIAAKKIKDAVPDDFSRSRILFAIEKPELLPKLSKEERSVAIKVKADFKSALDKLHDAGLLDKTKLSEDFINSYLPHIWKNPNGVKDSFIESILKKGIGTRHTKKRSIMFLEDGLAQGLEPMTMDIAELYQIYMNNISRAIMRSDAAKMVKDIPDGFGNKIVARTRKDAGDGYLKYDNPAFASAVGSNVGSVFVHPDALPSIRMMFESHNPGSTTKGLELLSFTAKRMLTMVSLFHMNALAESAIYSGMHSVTVQTALGAAVGFAAGELSGQDPVTTAEFAAIGSAAGGIRGIHNEKALRQVIKQLREGTDNMGVQDALKHGLKIDNFEDVGVGNDQFYNTLMLLGDKVDGSIPVLHKIAKAPFKAFGKVSGKKDIKDFTSFNRAMDSWMWGRIMTGGKLVVYQKNVAKSLMKAEKARAKGKQMPSDSEIKRSIAQFTNDAFGGQNWRNLVENIDNRVLRNFASKTLNPNARGFLQLGLFAPDWTISNLRILGKAIPGFEKDPMIAKMYRQYALRATIYMGFMGSVIQKIATGSSPLDDLNSPDETIKGLNDMFVHGVDLGDGQRMAMSKQAMEPFRWYDDPSHELVNKIGFLPKQFLNGLLQKQYVTVRGNSIVGPDLNKKDQILLREFVNNVVNVSEGFVPIWLQTRGDATSFAASFIGKPVRGKKN